MAAAEDGMEGEEEAVSPINMARGYCKTLPHSTDSSQHFYGPLASRITHYHRNIFTVKRSIGSTTGCTITEKAPTRPLLLRRRTNFMSTYRGVNACSA